LFTHKVEDEIPHPVAIVACLDPAVVSDEVGKRYAPNVENGIPAKVTKGGRDDGDEEPDEH